MVLLHGGICFTRKSNCLDKLVCSLKTCAPKVLVWTLRSFTVIQFQTEGFKSSSPLTLFFFKLGNCSALPLWAGTALEAVAVWCVLLVACGDNQAECPETAVPWWPVVHMCESKSHSYLGTPNLWDASARDSWERANAFSCCSCKCKQQSVSLE